MPKNPQQIAKLSRPRLHGAVPRGRLFALLDEKRNHAGIWIAGPPGAGKTTLAGSYVENRALDALWYQVDAGDDDASTFFYYLALAADRFRPTGAVLPLLTPEFLPDLAGFSRRFFREMFSWMPDPSVLVLDNFQESGPGLEKTLGTALLEVPAHLNVIVLSRERPPPAILSHVANEALVVVGWEDLKLTLEEVRPMVATRSALDEGTVQVLYERSDGWAAGLILMLERMRRADGAAAGIEAVSREAVFDYFAAQIFDTASVDTQDILLRTSVFPSFTLESARRISSRPGVERLLEELCRRQLFTYRRGASEPRFHYHDLFREFLQRRLQESLGLDERQALYREAAGLLVQAGSGEEAHPLYVLGQDWAAAAQLVRNFAPALLAQGRFQTLQNWIHSHGEARIEKDAWLLYWLGMACMQNDLNRAGEVLARAFDLFGAGRDAVGQLLCAAELIRARYYQYDDFGLMDPWIEACNRLLAAPVAFPDAAREMKVCSALVLALSAREPGHEKLPAALARTEQLLEADIDANQKIGAGMALLIHYTIVNQLPLAQQTFEKLSPLARSSQVTALNRAYWFLQFGYHLFRRADVRDAEEAWEEADRFTAQHGLKQTFFVGRCFRAYHFAALHDYHKGEAALEGLAGMLTDARPSTGALFHMGRCLLDLSREDGKSAAHNARLALACAQRLRRPFFDVAWRAHGSAALAMAGEHELAEEWIGEGWRVSAGSRLESYRTNLMMSRAYSALLQGNKASAHECIREMLRIGREFDSWAYLRTCPAVKDVVLEEALIADIEVPFVQAIVRKFQMSPRRPDIRNWPWPVKVHTLGAFRMEVDGAALIFARKVPKKPIALLKAIVAFGGRNVPEQKLMDALWSGEDGDAARETFAVSLHRLRKLLVHNDVVQLSEGLVSLDTGKCWTDVRAFEQKIAGMTRFDEFEAGADTVWSLYRGHFLSEDSDLPWTVSMREKLRSQFLQSLGKAGKELENAGRLEVAARLYQKGIESDELAEELYQGLMRCHMKSERRAEAMAVYRRLRQTLSVTLGISPSPQSESLFRQVQSA